MVKDDGNINRCFNVVLFLHFMLAIIIFILAETIGLWYVVNKLNIETGKTIDAVFIYQTAVLTMCLGITNNPYNSLFAANERFKFLSLLESINLIIRLLCVFLLLYYTGNHALKIYSCIMCLTTVNTFVVYHIIAKKNWADVIRLKLVKKWQYYKEVITFSNWNLLGVMAVVVQTTGCDLILNRFFGTVMNGVFSISKTFNSLVKSVSSSFDVTVAPQITKSYAVDDISRYYFLAITIGKISMLIFIVMFFTLYTELDLVLKLWLKDVPEGTSVFAKIQLLMAGVAMSNGGLNHVVNASGKINWFNIQLSIFFVSCIPVSYALYAMGYPPYSMLIVMLVADVIQKIVQLILLKKLLDFDIIKYVKGVHTRPFMVAFLMTIVTIAYSTVGVTNILGKILGVLFVFLLVSIFSYLIGLTRDEKSVAIGFVCRILKR